MTFALVHQQKKYITRSTYLHALALDSHSAATIHCLNAMRPFTVIRICFALIALRAETFAVPIGFVPPCAAAATLPLFLKVSQKSFCVTFALSHH